MKRLFVIVEGDTEAEFVKSVIAPYLREKEIENVTPIKIQTSRGYKGGFNNYEHLKNDIIKLLKNQTDIIVSTLVDFYAIPSNMPNYQSAMSLTNSNLKVAKLEEGIASDINDKRLLPYIQLHEFEALLFSSISGYEDNWSKNSRILIEINKIINNFENPEEINDSPLTAPSKRLKKIIIDYDKVLYGNIIALDIGIEDIMAKCPRFKNWIETLIEKVRN